MNWLRENFIYLFFGILALVLLLVTLNLQASLRQVQSPADNAMPVQNGPRAPDVVADQDPVDSGAAVEQSITTLPLVGSNTDPSAADQSSTLPTAESMTDRLFNAANVTVGEDQAMTSALISANPNSVGLQPYNDYLQNQDKLRAVSIRLPDGNIAAPNTSTVATGLYPLARPLFLYTSPTVIQAKPEVEAFLGCYLNQLPQVVSGTGFMLPSRALFAQAVQSFDATCQRCRREATNDHPLAAVVPSCDLADIPTRDLTMIGSFTLAPLSLRMAEWVRSLGYGGNITVVGAGTGAGFQRFCSEAEGEILNASRSVTSNERIRCSEQNRALLPFPVAVDALAIVVSRENQFLQTASIAELQQIFIHAQTWAEVDPQWPNGPILRTIPGRQSGTVDYFVEAVLEEGALAELAERRIAPLAAPDIGQTASRTAVTVDSAIAVPSVTVGSGLFVGGSAQVRLGYVDDGDRRSECAKATRYLGLVLQENFRLQVELRPFATVDELFATLAATDAADRVDLTFCYLDPLDRAQRQRYFSATAFIGSGYWQSGDNRLVILANSAVKSAVASENHCLSEFLKNLALTDLSLADPEPLSWYRQNQPLINSWLPCEPS